MATAFKKCRVCGDEYEACHTLRKNAGVFRWQEVACSPECGSKYLAAILESRSQQSGETDHAAKNATNIKTEEKLDIYIDDVDFDEVVIECEFDYDFDDAEETAE